MDLSTLFCLCLVLINDFKLNFALTGLTDVQNLIRKHVLNSYHIRGVRDMTKKKEI